MKNLYIIFFMLFIFTSCSDLTEKDSTTGFNKVFTTAKEKADNFNDPKIKNQQNISHKTIRQVIRIRSQHNLVKDGYSTLVLNVEYPYNLRGDALEKYFQDVVKKHIGKYSSIEINGYHHSIAEISGITAYYRFFSDKKTPVFKEYITQDILKRKEYITLPFRA